MPELLLARPVTERIATEARRATPVYVKSETIFVAGGSETKSHITGEVSGRHVSLIKRSYNADAITNWKEMKHRGLPVVPTLRTLDESSLLVTDVKADGSEVYGKSLALCLSAPDTWQRERERPEIDEIFIDVTSSHEFTAIKREANKLVLHAVSQDVLLPPDDPMELQIHPDGRWTLKILDVECATVGESERLRDKARILTKNWLSAKEFIGHLVFIRDCFQKKHP